MVSFQIKSKNKKCPILNLISLSHFALVLLMGQFFPCAFNYSINFKQEKTKKEKNLFISNALMLFQTKKYKKQNKISLQNPFFLLKDFRTVWIKTKHGIRMLEIKFKRVEKLMDQLMLVNERNFR